VVYLKIHYPAYFNLFYCTDISEDGSGGLTPWIMAAASGAALVMTTVVCTTAVGNLKVVFPSFVALLSFQPDFMKSQHKLLI